MTASRVLYWVIRWRPRPGALQEYLHTCRPYLSRWTRRQRLAKRYTSKAEAKTYQAMWDSALLRNGIGPVLVRVVSKRAKKGGRK